MAKALKLPGNKLIKGEFYKVIIAEDLFDSQTSDSVREHILPAVRRGTAKWAGVE